MKKLILTLLLILILSGCKETVSDADLLTQAYYDLSIEETISNESTLPQSINELSITWTTSISNLIEDNQLLDYEYNTSGTISASITNGPSTLVKTFTITVNGSRDLSFDEAYVIDVVELYEDIQTTDISDNIILESNSGAAWITYTSSHPELISTTGQVTRPSFEEGNQTVTITGLVTVNQAQATFVLTFNVLAQEENNFSYTGYYSGMNNLTGEALRIFLHNLIDDHHILSYDEVKYALRDTDEDPNNPNNVILLYTGRSQAKTTFGGGIDDYNREHVWAKSHGDFGNANGPGTDLHHLRPTDASVNSLRGNLDFDWGGNIVNDGNIPTDNLRDSNSFEPRDEVKGDIARMLFYMAIRYEGDDGYVDLEINDSVGNGSNPFIGKLSVLIEWHLMDPPDEFEQDRNDAIYDYQGNRNPFIDHPELVELLFGTTN